MPAYHLDEHQLAQFCQHALASGAFVRRFHRRQADKLPKPARIAALRVAGLDDRGQIVEQWIERLGVAGEVAADEPRRSRSVTAIVEGERQLTAIKTVKRAGWQRTRAHTRAARQDMRIAFCIDDN